ncbi:hypothetical protein A2442_00085 [Candidatus Campbellbacteria bacterium RIFOXYC2_FULL_35_25]|uniref:Glycine zipper domain-containing protein n=1 Tax=Candidatus Campbellbacteria bacterium RIFOXYC2_FULL_35_25 TaxID=1797582 RepID=A0A1F5EHQ4_9BACT|nr:MAG: hypothetical protein A2442_00085 [Candidatus Campbellbacteria bacterium RIFOXYC2_FULL_35_25]
MKKKFLILIFFFVVLVGVFAPIGASVAHASPIDVTKLTCNMFLHPINFSVEGCLVVIAEEIFYKPAAFVLKVTAGIFNYFLVWSMSSSVLNASFVNTAWDNLRDFANMMFIFVLIAISISIILDFGKFAQKKLIIDVIIIALLINFSLFASRIVIDAGNIFTLGFYDAIDAPAGPPVPSGILAQKDVASAIRNAFEPSNIVSGTALTAWINDEGGSVAVLAIIYIVSAAMCLYLSYLFALASFIVVVRVIWLWLLMLISPLAFISFTMPGTKSLWNRWWIKLFDQAFCLVIFLFFIWLTLGILHSNFYSSLFKPSMNEMKFIEIMMMVVMQFILVITLFRTGLEETRKKCSDGGVGAKVMGMAKVAAIATGAGVAGYAARGAVGGYAARKADQMEKEGKGDTTYGKMKLQTLRAVGNKKFGMKEGYTQRVASQRAGHTAYEKSLSGKKVQERDIYGELSFDDQNNPIMTKSAQEKYRENQKAKQKWREEGVLPNLLRRTAEVGGSATGATGGIATGAVLGSVAGPIGTVMGGAIGGVVGAFAGQRATRGATLADSGRKAYLDSAEKLSEKSKELEKSKKELEKLKDLKQASIAKEDDNETGRLRDEIFNKEKEIKKLEGEANKLKGEEKKAEQAGGGSKKKK